MPKLESNKDAQEQSIYKYALAAGLILGTAAVVGHGAKAILNSGTAASVKGATADSLYKGLGKTSTGQDAGKILSEGLKDTFGHNKYKDDLLRQKLANGFGVVEKEQGELSKWLNGARQHSQFKLDKDALNKGLIDSGIGRRDRRGIIKEAKAKVKGFNEVLSGKVDVAAGSWAGADPSKLGLAGRQSRIVEIADQTFDLNELGYDPSKIKGRGITLTGDQVSSAAMKGDTSLNNLSQGRMSIDDFIKEQQARNYADFKDSGRFAHRMGDTNSAKAAMAGKMPTPEQVQADKLNAKLARNNANDYGGSFSRMQNEAYAANDQYDINKTIERKAEAARRGKTKEAAARWADIQQEAYNAATGTNYAPIDKKAHAAKQKEYEKFWNDDLDKQMKHGDIDELLRRLRVDEYDASNKDYSFDIDSAISNASQPMVYKDNKEATGDILKQIREQHPKETNGIRYNISNAKPKSKVTDLGQASSTSDGRKGKVTIFPSAIDRKLQNRFGSDYDTKYPNALRDATEFTIGHETGHINQLRSHDKELINKLETDYYSDKGGKKKILQLAREKGDPEAIKIYRGSPKETYADNFASRYLTDRNPELPKNLAKDSSNVDSNKWLKKYYSKSK